MGTYELGTLSTVPASLRPDLLAGPTQAALTQTGRLLESVGVVEIDPAVSDTAATQQEYGLQPDMLANCVVVGGKREGAERFAAMRRAGDHSCGRQRGGEEATWMFARRRFC